MLPLDVSKSGFEEPGQDIVLVRGQDQPRHGQPHPRGQVAGKDVAEVTRRHGESDPLAPGLRHDAQTRMKVVNHLGQQPGPVD